MKKEDILKILEEADNSLSKLSDKQLEYHSSEAKKNLGRNTIDNNRSNEGASKGGKIGGAKAGKKAKDEKLGFHSFTKEQRSEIGKRVGKEIGPRSQKEGFGIFGLSDKQKLKNAKKGGKNSVKSEKHPNNVKEKCIHCGYETTLPLIRRWHNDNCKQK